MIKYLKVSCETVQTHSALKFKHLLGVFGEKCFIFSLKHAFYIFINIFIIGSLALLSFVQENILSCDGLVSLKYKKFPSRLFMFIKYVVIAFGKVAPFSMIILTDFL